MRRGVAFAAGVPALALVLSACAPTNQGDPCGAASREIDLFVLLGNTTSGAYDACLDELRDELARARLRARVLQGEAVRLEAEAADLEGERAAAARRLAAANTRQAGVLARLEMAREARSVDRARLRDVLAQEAELSRELEELNRGSGVDAVDAERLENEQEELIRRIDAMLGIE